MTLTNSFREYINRGLGLWYILIVLWYCIQPYASCPSGTFESDFLSGGCAVCPKKSKSCENEEYGDSVRCFKACSKLCKLYVYVHQTISHNIEMVSDECVEASQIKNCSTIYAYTKYGYIYN